MTDCEQMDCVLLRVERVDDPIVSYACAKPRRSLQTMMRIRCEPQADSVDLCFDACSQRRRQFEEDGIEAVVVDLSRDAHEPSGSRTRPVRPFAMSRSDCCTARSNS